MDGLRPVIQKVVFFLSLGKKKKNWPALGSAFNHEGLIHRLSMGFSRAHCEDVLQGNSRWVSVAAASYCAAAAARLEMPWGLPAHPSGMAGDASLAFTQKAPLEGRRYVGRLSR